MTVRVLQHSAHTLSAFFEQDGDAVSTITTPKVTITNTVTGDEVQAEDDATDAGSGKLTYALTPTHTATIQPLKAHWTGTIGGAPWELDTYVEVVGDVLYTVASARAFDADALSENAPVDYSDDDILAMRDLIAESFEDVCGVTFGTRWAREVLDGDGGHELWLGRVKLQSVSKVEMREHGSQTWTAFTADELSDLLVSSNGRIERESTGNFWRGRRNIRVTYLHGWQPIPNEIRRAALWLTRDQIAGNDLPRNAIAQTDQLGTFTLAVPGRRGSYYGLPQVDEVVGRLARLKAGIA